MKSFVAYESMYGNTARIAEAIAHGLTEQGVETIVAPLDDATPEDLSGIDLLIAGGPTHVHGMSRDSTRASAARDEKNDYGRPTVTPGIRAWLDALPAANGCRAAAFDTRMEGPMALTGSAAKGISRQLSRHGFRQASPPQSFLVTKTTTLVEGEIERATAWAIAIAGDRDAAVNPRSRA